MKVVESGAGVRVHADQPHLVSLGGGRLSTAVTLLPLPHGEYIYTVEALLTNVVRVLMIITRSRCIVI